MRRLRRPGPRFRALTSPGRGALRVGLLVVLGALSVALVLLSDGRTPAAAGPVASAWLTACGHGMAVAEPEANPALVADCSALLEARDALRGAAELNWSAELGLSEWTGVTVGTVGGVQRVTVLNLERQGLDGVIPAALDRLSGLRELRLSRSNRLTGAIPPSLGWLSDLWLLHLARNQLSGVIPTQLGHLLDLDNLLRLYVQGNAGFSGCVPPSLREVRTNDLARLNLPDCAADAPVIADTTEPSYTLTMTVGDGGSVDPPGTTTHTEGIPVTLTASWDDATHTFGGWGGDCSGAEPTCELTMDADKTVTATFAERCQSATDPTCIRVVYQGAPDDYTQVADVPDTVIIEPQADGRYLVERGQQITVVTAAPLPSGYTRFYLQRRPLQVSVSPTSYERLIPPVGTTYTFTVTTDERGPSPISFDLTAARPRPLPRPGQKPELGDVVVTTEFLLPLTLELASSRALCTANTLTELSWTIAGGRPPYTLTIDGETVDANAESHRANCGAIPADPMGPVPGTTPAKTFRASVTGSQATPDTATDEVQVGLAPALAAPTRLEYEPYPKFASVHWRSVVGAGSQSERVESRGRARYAAYHVRYRAVGATQWRYAVEDYLSYGLPSEWEQPGLGVHELEVAAIRHPLEAETPAALNWSERLRYAHGAPIGNASVTATVDTVTVQWEAQPLAGYGFVTIESDNGWRKDVFGEPEDAGTHRHIFEHVEPGTDYEVKIYKAFAEKGGPPVTLTVRTSPPPEGWTTPPLGPQNLRAIAARHGSLTCLTIDWDAPYANADHRYHIFVVEEETYLQIDSAVINDGTTRFFTCGRDTHRNVEPSRLYHIRVNHHGIRTGTATISITTPAKDTRAQSSTEPDSAPQVKLPPLALELSSSRDLCTANTLTELSWTISGGIPPYTLTIDGETVDSDAESHRVNCGPLMLDPLTQEPLSDQNKTFSAAVSDAQETSTVASASIRVDLAPPLIAPVDITYASHDASVQMSWDWNRTFPRFSDYPTFALLRHRPAASDDWRYLIAQPLRSDPTFRLELPTGNHLVAVAAIRHEIELQTPDALQWSDARQMAGAFPPPNVRATATHDTITVSWDRQPHLVGQRTSARIRRSDLTAPWQGGWGKSVDEVYGQSGRHELVFPGMEPNTDYRVQVDVGVPDSVIEIVTSVRTLAPPPGWTAPPRGPQNLGASATDACITANWDLPYPGAPNRWFVELFSAETGQPWHFAWIHSKSSWTICGSRSGHPLNAGAQYRIRVEHLSVVPHAAEIVVTTDAAAQPRSQRAGTGIGQDMRLLPFAPQWPVSMDGRFAMTDDPFEWRGNRFHAGLGYR